MKIIDAHLHLFPAGNELTDKMVKSVGHENSVEHLRKVYSELDMAHGIIMGNRSLELDYHDYPNDLFHYCIGLDSSLFCEGDSVIPDFAEKVEQHLMRDSCCGVKLYPGYNKISLADEIYEPVYQLAQKYDKPVAIHMGLTSRARAHLKYCHPLALDEVAADHRKTRFVMCHFGNPFFESSAAVLVKNPNVSTDLSGLLEGRLDLSQYLEEQQGYVFLLKSWLAASCCWDKIMFGTDWPIVNLGEYIGFIKEIVPEKQWEKVFFDNANKIYGLGL